MKYEVLIPDDVQEVFENLNNDWVVFQQSLVEAEVMLKKHKVMASGCLATCVTWSTKWLPGLMLLFVIYFVEILVPGDYLYDINLRGAC